MQSGSSQSHHKMSKTFHPTYPSFWEYILYRRMSIHVSLLVQQEGHARGVAVSNGAVESGCSVLAAQEHEHVREIIT